MKFKIEKSVVIKLLIIAALFVIAPQAIPFSIELVLMADIMGLEALVLLLLYQSRHSVAAQLANFAEWRSHAAATMILLANVYVFQPKIFMTHAAGSSLILMFACSIVMALAIWVPAIYLSGGGFA